jgi:hypothetical protein
MLRPISNATSQARLNGLEKPGDAQLRMARKPLGDWTAECAGHADVESPDLPF